MDRNTRLFLSYFSHCCDKNLSKSKLMKEGFVLVPSGEGMLVSVSVK